MAIYDWMKTAGGETPPWASYAASQPRPAMLPGSSGEVARTRGAMAFMQGLGQGTQAQAQSQAQKKIQALMLVQSGMATWSPEARELASSQGMGAIVNSPDILNYLIPTDISKMTPSTQLSREKFEYTKQKPVKAGGRDYTIDQAISLLRILERDISGDIRYIKNRTQHPYYTLYDELFKGVSGKISFPLGVKSPQELIKAAPPTKTTTEEIKKLQSAVKKRPSLDELFGE